MPKRYASAAPPVTQPPLGEPPEPPIPHLRLDGISKRLTLAQGKRPGGLHLRDFTPRGRHSPAAAVSASPAARRHQEVQHARDMAQAQRAQQPGAAAQVAGAAAGAGAERAVKTGQLRRQERAKATTKLAEDEAEETPQTTGPHPQPKPQAGPTTSTRPRPPGRRTGQLMGETYNATTHPERSEREAKHGTYLNPTGSYYRQDIEQPARRAAKREEREGKAAARPGKPGKLRPPAGTKIEKPQPQPEPKRAAPPVGGLRGSTARGGSQPMRAVPFTGAAEQVRQIPVEKERPTLKQLQREAGIKPGEGMRIVPAAETGQPQRAEPTPRKPIHPQARPRSMGSLIAFARAHDAGDEAGAVRHLRGFKHEVARARIERAGEQAGTAAIGAQAPKRGRESAKAKRTREEAEATARAKRGEQVAGADELAPEQVGAAADPARLAIMERRAADYEAIAAHPTTTKEQSRDYRREAKRLRAEIARLTSSP